MDRKQDKAMPVEAEHIVPKKRGRPPHIIEGIDVTPEEVAKALMRCPPLRDSDPKEKA